jgi:hypothetical protein
MKYYIGSMKEVPFDELKKGEVYYIESNSSIDRNVDRTVKKMATFDKYYIVEYDGDELTIANFTNFRPVPKSKSKSKSKSKDNLPSSSVTGFTDDAKFFKPTKDSLMMRSIVNQRTKSSIGTDIIKDMGYGGASKRKDRTATKRNKFSNRKTARKCI